MLVLCLATPLLATQANPSPKQRELAQRLLDAMNLQKTLHDTIDTMYEAMQKQFLASADTSDKESVAEAEDTWKSFREKAAKIDFAAELRDSYAEIYAKHFSEKELQDIVAFYESPTGQKTVQELPKLAGEAMQVGADHLTTQIQQAMTDALLEQEKKRPWRKTMREMRSVGAAVEAYAIDHDEEYPAGDYESLKKLLEPEYIKTLPDHDMWDHSYAYVASDDRHHYRIVSAGGDTIFEWDSRRVPSEKDSKQPPASIYRERLEDDLIFADGEFIQAPVQSKPKPPAKK